MKAWINADGILHIRGETPVEVYALKKWLEEAPQSGEFPDNMIVDLFILPEEKS